VEHSQKGRLHIPYYMPRLHKIQQQPSRSRNDDRAAADTPTPTTEDAHSDMFLPEHARLQARLDDVEWARDYRATHPTQPGAGRKGMKGRELSVFSREIPRRTLLL
jgi:hypothetical protein